MQYPGTTAVVTGAASGIGRALAIELAKRGAHVALSDVNATGLAETAAECKRDGVDVRRSLIGLDAVVIDAVPRILGARYEGIAARGARILGPRVGLDLEH